MIRSSISQRLLPALAFALLCFDVTAQPRAAHNVSLTPEQRQVLSNAGMLAAHPDVRWRQAGLLELDRGNLDLARDYLTRSARYADKPAQAMLAEMLWTGTGVARDPSQAYAWMDLAAERGYVVFVAHREKYWGALSEPEKAAAIAFGRDLYAEFGDDVAKARLEKVIERASRQRTGSHVGARSAVRVYGVPNYSATGSVLDLAHKRVMVGAELHDYYDARYWKPRAYWQWQDEQYAGVPARWSVGSVEVGDVSASKDE